MHEVRYALRSLARQPGFCASVILTLALGIGANTAMFSVFDAVVLHPLPYRDAGRLLLVWQKTPQGKETPVAPVNYLEWSKQVKSFERLLGMRTLFFNYRGRGESHQLLGAQVSRGFFSALGIQPTAGREFLPGAETSDQDHVVVLSYGLWRREFSGDIRALGSSITMNGEAYTVIGVAAPNFDESLAMRGIDVWTPLGIDQHPEQNAGMRSNTMAVFGRLKPHVTLQEADREMRIVARRLESEFPEIDRGWSAMVTPLQDYGVGKLRSTIAALLVAVGMVLLIACLNVANLLLARAEVRYKEIAIRAALGASRGRLIRQLLAETMLLAVAGGICGVTLAYFGVRLLIAFKGVELPGLENAGLNASVLAFTCAVTLVTGVLFGLLPSRQMLGRDLKQAVGESGRGSVTSRRGHLSRNALVISETALSLVLLAGALLMARSLLWLQTENRGFVSGHLLSFRVSFSRTDFPGPTSMAAYYGGLMDRLAALPGVVGAAADTNLPIDGFVLTGQLFRLPGLVFPPSERPAAGCDLVNGSYFRTLEIPLLQGRPFDGRDRAEAPPVAIVSTSLARRYFPGRNPVGGKIIVATPGKAAIEVTREIVGVAGDIRYLTRGAEESLEIYLPFAQTTWPNVFVMLRTTRDPEALAPSVRAALREPGFNQQSVAEFRGMDDRIAALNDKPRMNSFLAATFALIAVLLAAVGVYGVVSYSTSQRAREIGVRLALGATPRDIVRWILGRALRLTAAGLALGLIVQLALSPILGSLIYGASPRDAWSLLAGVIVLGSLALIASYIPARRAVRGDPMAALRSE
ncbi:MAG TPA: ABC transporter permease [Bryobacteraceae bacterium]|nr:ABC transporter permease [Bryobacteraceae bacterium]